MDSPASSSKHWLLITLAMLMVLALVFVLFDEPMAQISHWALAQSHVSTYRLATLALLLLCIDLFLPIPSSLVAMTLANQYTPWLALILLWCGFNISSALGYWIGRAMARGLLPARYIRLSQAGKGSSVDLLMVCLARPVPLVAETLVLLAGARGLSWRRFAISVCLANLLLSMAYLTAGQGLASFPALVGVLFGATLVPALGYALWHYWRRSAGAFGQDGLTVTFDYAIRFTRDAFEPGNPVVVDTLCRNDPGKCLRLSVFADEGVLTSQPRLAEQIRSYVQAHGDRLRLNGQIETIPSGEAGKTLETITALHQSMLRLQLDRHSLIMAIGGGAALDTIGFAAATFHRGIRLVRLPTTVLAQGDAGVGVKSGVNAMGEKNLLGSFLPPYAVINDRELLQTLDARQRLAGIAETVKVAAIRDSTLFEWLEQHGPTLVTDDDKLAHVVEQGALLHWRQITRGGDPFEFGSARPLDFGHWSAHRLEIASKHDLNHGEAVAIGMAIDTLFAEQVGLCDSQTSERLLALLEAIGFVLWHPVLSMPQDELFEMLSGALEAFRQHLGGDLCVTQLTDIGQAVEVGHMDMDQIMLAVERLAQRHDALPQAKGTPLCI